MSIFNRNTYTGAVPKRSFTLEDSTFEIQGIRCREIGPCPMHSHSDGCFELHFIREGKGFFIIDGVKYTYVPGDMLLIGPNVKHAKFIDEGEKLVDLWINLHGEKVILSKRKNVAEKGRIFMDDLFLNMRVWKGKADEDAKNLMVSMIRELNDRMPGYEDYIVGSMKMLVVNIGRCIRTDKNLSTAAMRHSDSPEVIMDDYFLKSDYEFSLSELSEKLNLSERQTERLVKDTYGKNFREMVLDSRMSKAKQLLIENPELSTTEIAEKLGYSTLEYFSSSFRKNCGESPRDFRKHFLKK